MSDERQISGRLIAAARALTGISKADFAEVAGLPLAMIGIMESGGSALLRSGPDIEAVSRALEKLGVIIVDESDGMGAGVRLKFTRQDVRQIARWKVRAESSAPMMRHSLNTVTSNHGHAVGGICR